MDGGQLGMRLSDGIVSLAFFAADRKLEIRLCKQGGFREIFLDNEYHSMRLFELLPAALVILNNVDYENY